MYKYLPLGLFCRPAFGRLVGTGKGERGGRLLAVTFLKGSSYWENWYF